MPLPALALVVAIGCEAKPRAPVMSDDPIYHNDQLGLRFQIPEGWTQYANAMIPPGPQSKSRLVVAYRSVQNRGAAFEVSIVDGPADSDLRAVAVEPTHGVKEWTPLGNPESITCGGVPAQRFRYSGRVDREPLIKEVVAVRRGGRIVSLVLIADATDTGALSATRRSIATISWR